MLDKLRVLEVRVRCLFGSRDYFRIVQPDSWTSFPCWRGRNEDRALSANRNPIPGPSPFNKGKVKTPTPNIQTMSFLTWPEMHGAITHFPIALLLGGLFFDIAAQIKKRDENLAHAWRIVSFWMLVLAVLSSVPSLFTGWVTGNQIYGSQGPMPAIFVWHRALAFFSSGTAILLLLMRVRARDYESSTRADSRRAPLLVLALLAAIAVGATGHFGGRMVFGSEDDGNTGTFADDKTSTRNVDKPKFDTKLVTAGAKVYSTESCASCHQIEGKGKKRGPDLTFIGREEPSVQWHIEHLKNPESKKPGSAMPSYDYLSPQQLKELATYLAARR